MFFNPDLKECSLWLIYKTVDSNTFSQCSSVKFIKTLFIWLSKVQVHKNNDETKSSSKRNVDWSQKQSHDIFILSFYFMEVVIGHGLEGYPWTFSME